MPAIRTCYIVETEEEGFWNGKILFRVTRRDDGTYYAETRRCGIGQPARTTTLAINQLAEEMGVTVKGIYWHSEEELICAKEIRQ